MLISFMLLKKKKCKPCHAPHVSRITTRGASFMEVFFGVAKK